MLIKGGLLFALLAHEALTAPTAAASASQQPQYPFLSADGFTSDVWVQALAKAQQVVGGLSLEEKEGLCYADGPTGLNSKYSTQWPNELAAAATWDRDLIYLRAAAEGAEFSRVGSAVPFSIVAGPVGRSVYDGRSWEGFGPDPFLAGEAVRATVRAFQDAGVTGLLKHFVGNEQEYLRYGSPGGYLRSNDSATIDDIIDPATLRELYTYAFAEGIREGAGGIMCSYNKLDGVYACESGSLLNDLLKTELNFHGAVITDFGAGRTTYGTAINGTDAIGGFAYMNLSGKQLAPFIQNGSVPEAVVDDKLVRILTPFYALDQESLPEVDYNRWVANKTSVLVAREVMEGAITLLKNSNETGLGLPIKGVKAVALIGSAAAPGRFGILNNLGTFWYLNSSPFTGAISDGGGSGSSPAAYVVDPLAGFVKAGLEQERPVAIDGFYSDNPTDGIVIGETGPVVPIDVKLEGAPVAVVHVAAVAEEGYDRISLELLNNGSALINYVAARHNNTVVVIEAPGAVDMSQWYSHPNVTAILFSYFGGQEVGNAIANVAFGEVNPSGKLPFTIAKNVSDYPVNLYNGSIVVNPISNFSEGVFIDYKYFDEKDITPLYEFGYGLSYTTLAKTGPCPAAVRETNEKLYVDDKLSDMGVYDYAATVQATVTNTGKVDGAEVAQLYVTYPDSVPRKMPVKSLRGFVKPYLKAGESQTVQFELRNKDLAYWSPVYNGWMLPRGKFTFHVGTSSRALPHQLDFTV